MQMLHDQILVKATRDEKTTEGGIILPGERENDSQEGNVVAVGPGRLLENGNRVPVDVNVGDVVIYAKFAGHEVEVAGEKLRVIREHEVLCVLEGQ